MTKEELQSTRTDPKFLEFLDKKEKEARETKNIKELYEVMDNILILDLDEERLNSIYKLILDIAFKNIDTILQSGKKLIFNGDDIYYIRAVYEYAIELWSNEHFTQAKELFFILTNIIDDEKLIQSCNVHLINCHEELDMELFYFKFVDMDAKKDDTRYEYFLMNFKIDANKFCQENKALLQSVDTELKHLLGS